MAAQIVIMDQDTIEEYSFEANDEKSLLISIHSHGNSSAFVKRTKVNGIVDILVLQFNDTLVDEEFAGGMTDHDASRIYDFLYKHRNDFVDKIIFQCEDGIGRSVGCAAAFEQQVFGTIEILSNPEYTINTLCYNKVRTILEDTKDTFRNYTETKEQAMERELAIKFTNDSKSTGEFTSYESIVADIANGINNKEFKAGDELPAIDTLAKAMNKSKYTVAKAYELLEDEGYIKEISGGAYIVTANSVVKYNDSVYKELESNMDNIVSLAKNENISLDKLIQILIKAYGI